MKREVNILVLFILLVGFCIPDSVYSQAWGGRKKKAGFWDDWSINGNVGLTSFFGDLSIYDDEIIQKLSQESGPSVSAILTKYLKNKKYGISGQLLYGGFKAESSNHTAFEASLIEYNFSLRFNLINIIFVDNYSPVGLEAYGGIGQFLFNVQKWTPVEGGTQESEINTGTPEFVYYFGMGLYYNINEKIGITTDISLRQAQNDKLDDLNKNDNFDYYTHISVGVTYYIASFKKQSAFGRGSPSKGRMPGRLPMRRRR
ncbi:MAG: hypothetical protein R2750_05810 [Bacteroidales bacterium]